MSIPLLDFPVHVFDERECHTGEGPVWDERNSRVVWVDVLGSRVLWRSFAGAKAGELKMPSHVGAVLPTEDLTWLACLQDGIYQMELDGDRLDLLARFPSAPSWHGEVPVMRANDAKTGPDGSAYVGVMAYETERFPGSGSVFRLSRSGLDAAITQTTLSNGIDWSPDGRTMYHIDSARGTVEAFDFEGGPILETRRVIARVDPSSGIPDGMSIDVEGNLWIGLWDGRGILGINSTGEVLGRLSIPAQHVTSCAFAGSDLSALIVTTARFDQGSGALVGATFVVDMPVAGRPQTRVHLPL